MDAVTRDNREFIVDVSLYANTSGQLMPTVFWIGDRPLVNRLALAMDKDFEWKAVFRDQIGVHSPATSGGKREDVVWCNLAALRFDVRLRQWSLCPPIITFGDHQLVRLPIGGVEHPPLSRRLVMIDRWPSGEVSDGRFDKGRVRLPFSSTLPQFQIVEVIEVP